MSSHLSTLEANSITIIREAYARVKPLGMLWSIGKDSTVLAWLARKAFFGRIPFPLIHLDTGMELDEVYEYRDRYTRDWNLDLISEDCPPYEAMDPSLPPNTRAAARKTEGLKQLIAARGMRGILVGIRRDEQAHRSKERIFSPRANSGSWDYKDQPAEFWGFYKTEFDQDTHLRIHPLLAWTEEDIWRYIKREGIPVVPLYFARDGMRYRSLGEKNITKPVPSTAATIDEIIEEVRSSKTSERAGRTMDNETEDAFERLRTTGYM